MEIVMSIVDLFCGTGGILVVVAGLAYRALTRLEGSLKVNIALTLRSVKRKLASGGSDL